MFKELVELTERFRDDDMFLPLGYEKKAVNWVINIDAETGEADIQGPYRKGDTRLYKAPVRARQGKVSKKNMKPYLLVDNASYVLGVTPPGKDDETKLSHKGFISLLNQAYNQTKSEELSLIIDFLKKENYINEISNILPKDIVTFQVRPNEILFEKTEFQAFWKKHLEKEHVSGTGNCSVCGKNRPIVRILPNTIKIMGQDCKITSFNKAAFESFKKKRTENSPLCFDCVARITECLSFFLRKKSHHTVIAKDDSKGQGRYQLRDQLAVYWLKEEAIFETEGQKEILNEDVFACLLENEEIHENVDGETKISQLERLLKLPWHGDESSLQISSNRFYLGILTPNKARLVLREWMDVSLDKLLKNLEIYIQAAKIVSPDGMEIRVPSIPAILSALKPEDTKSSSPYANIVRDLLRTAFKGQKPPEGLLRNALLRFRIPDKKKEKFEDIRKQKNRRHALASAMKLVLTHKTKEAENMEKLDEHKKDTAYLCGKLLSILEEAQRKASKINTTLVDSFFSAACTAPATTFTTLLNRATISYFPKIRRKMWGYQEMEERLEKVMKTIDEEGGFPKELNINQQALFCLGFYSQRAEFSAIRIEQRNAKQKEKEGK